MQIPRGLRPLVMTTKNTNARDGNNMICGGNRDASAALGMDRSSLALGWMVRRSRCASGVHPMHRCFATLNMTSAFLDAFWGWLQERQMQIPRGLRPLVMTTKNTNARDDNKKHQRS